MPSRQPTLVEVEDLLEQRVAERVCEEGERKDLEGPKRLLGSGLGFRGLGFIGLIGFIEFIGFIGVIGFIGFIGFIG